MMGQPGFNQTSAEFNATNTDPFTGYTQAQSNLAALFPGYVSPDSAINDPRAAAAQVTRAQHEEWVKDFQPLEQNLIGMTTYNGNKGLASDIINNQADKINQNYDTSQGTATRQLGRYGLSMNPAEAAVNSRETDLAKAAAQVDMRNKVNTWQGDLNRSIIGGGVSTGR